LASFDPLATHPFTNNSGLLPVPAQPSQFPHPLPSPLRTEHTELPAPAKPGTATTPPPTLRAPKPRAPPMAKSKSAMSAPRRPIFVPFRPERSSPELDEILLKKRVSDMFSNKATWSIDQ
ncbi:hypothetical protein WOLCODRAFT_43048, partial [Wolfiporia cocos MD-104 SS10]